jgi:hypothetical protein
MLKSKFMEVMMLRMCLLISLLSSSHALAGLWTSGGGEGFPDSTNPWFVTNTKVVTYCVDVGDEFGVSPDRANFLVKEAINYWKQDFERLRHVLKTYGNLDLYTFPGQYEDLGLATQEFRKVACSDDVDLRFQLGVLTKEQRRYGPLRQPGKVIGLAVRTAYDRKNLKGKGFIYIAPAWGRDRYQGEDLISDAWSLGNGGRLYRVLIHELGHVFGFGHSNVGEIMSAHYPAIVLSKKSVDTYEGRVERLGSYLVPTYLGYSYDFCGPGDLFRRFFALEPEQKICLRVKLNYEQLKAYVTGYDEKLNAAMSPYLVLHFDKTKSKRDVRSFVWLWLPPEQVVYDTWKPKLISPGVVGLRLVGVLPATNSSPERQLLVEVRPENDAWVSHDRFVLSGILNGEYYPNLRL